jgi:hypothetical protein
MARIATRNGVRPERDNMQIEKLEIALAETTLVHAMLRLEAGIEFAPDAQLQILAPGRSEILYERNMSTVLPVAWLPRGGYHLQCLLHDLELPAGDYRLRLVLLSEIARERQVLADQSIPVRLAETRRATGSQEPAWSLQSLPGTRAVGELAWSRGHADWFFRHFDHAALVVTEYLLKQHPLLQGRILDVGCGDGIIDLGIFLRSRNWLGIDPSRATNGCPRRWRERPAARSAGRSPGLGTVAVPRRRRQRDSVSRRLLRCGSVRGSWNTSRALPRPRRKSAAC